MNMRNVLAQFLLTGGKIRLVMAKLLLIEENGSIQETQMGQELTIGRAYSNLLRLDGDEISRVHAIVYRRAGDYILRDLDSKNGVFLNGQKVANALIGGGDEIRIGRHLMIFDPPEGFDMKAFLRKHNLAQMDETMGVGVSSTFHGADTNSAPNRAVSAQPTSSDSGIQVFFALNEVEGMADSVRIPSTDEFFSELLRMNQKLTELSNPDELEDESAVYQHFLNATVTALGADRGVIVLKEEGGEVLKLGSIIPKDKDVSVNRVVLRSALRQNEAVLCNDALNDERFARTETVAKERIGSLIAYPMMRGDQPAGLIYADVQDRSGAFRREHLLILRFVSRLLLLALRRAVAGRHPR